MSGQVHWMTIVVPNQSGQEMHLRKSREKHEKGRRAEREEFSTVQSIVSDV